MRGPKEFGSLEVKAGSDVWSLGPASGSRCDEWWNEVNNCFKVKMTALHQLFSRLHVFKKALDG